MSERQYTIPKDVWDECICIIRGYDRLRDEYESVLQSTPPPPDGQPKPTCPGNPTEREAMKRAMMAMRLNAVDEAFTVIHPDYRQAIRDNIVKRKRYPDYAHRQTFVRWKTRMVRYLAISLLLLDPTPPSDEKKS